MNAMEIPIGRKGKILSGDRMGSYVLVRDDQVNTGGYLVLTSASISFSVPGDGFNNWAENLDQVKKLFEQFKWEIEWLESEPGAKG